MRKLVLDLVRPYHGWLAIVFIAMLIETAMSMAGPWPLKIVIDNVLGSHPLPEWLRWIRDLPFGEQQDGPCGVAAAGVVLIAIIGAIATYIDNYYTESVGQWVANDLRVKIYDHLQRMSLGYYDHQQTGVLLSTITNDVSTVQDFASSATLGILVDLLTIVGIVGLMFWLNWDFALVAVGVTPFLLLFVMRFKKAVKKAQHQVRLHQADIVTVVQEGLESVRVVKAYGRQDLEESRLAEVEPGHRRRSAQGAEGEVVALARGDGRRVAVHGIRPLARRVADRRRCDDRRRADGIPCVPEQVLQAGAGPGEDDQLDRGGGGGAGAHPGHPRNRRRSFPNATMRANSSLRVARSRWSMSPSATIPRRRSCVMSAFTIAPGQMVGVVGTTGGGKSTVVGLIPRFYDANAGRVLVDGVDVRDYTKNSLRSQIGFVLQDTVLFRGTIRENIAYGRPGATEEEIIEAAKLANAHDFIASMKHGYDSAVGERGLTLSGGQRQRIGIARAIIRNAPILILDEPTAALDTESERLVIEGLERLMKGRTVDHHRPPPVDHPRCKQDPRAQGRHRRRTGHARRTHQARRCLRRAAPYPVRAAAPLRRRQRRRVTQLRPHTTSWPVH